MITHTRYTNDKESKEQCKTEFQLYSTICLSTNQQLDIVDIRVDIRESWNHKSAKRNNFLLLSQLSL